MQFVLSEKLRYWWPVTVRIPDPETPGKFVTQTLKIQFEAEDRDDAIAAQEEYENLTSAKDRADFEEKRLLSRCKNWDDVVSADKEPVPFTEQNFRAALQRSWFRDGVYRGYSESLNGQEARLGN